jgi:type IV pilus assembly protein PilB
VRRVCTQCKAPHPLPASALIDVGFDAEQAEKIVPAHGKGCERCNNTGYKGRVGLYEVMEVTDALRELILVGASALELRRKSLELGMISLRQSGLRKIADGVTTIEEVVRETMK